MRRIVQLKGERRGRDKRQSSAGRVREMCILVLNTFSISRRRRNYRAFVMMHGFLL